MLKAYFNYPNPHVTAHGDPTCGHVNQMAKAGQRDVRINSQTISSELQRFEKKEYPFAAKATLNDVWLTVDFADHDFELAVVNHVRQLFARHYTPFIGMELAKHC